jgi:hypothetical protein
MLEVQIQWEQINSIMDNRYKNNIFSNSLKHNTESLIPVKFKEQIMYL